MRKPYIKPRLLRVEVVGDLPVLWATLQRLNLPATLDCHYPAPLHWKGPLSPGEVLAVWLLFIVSQGDHCLNHVQSWVDQHQTTLAALLAKPVVPTDLHDDRLADWLTRLGDGDSFHAVERDLNQQTVRVYELPTDLVRIDTTTANSYADVLSEQGLLQFGHSKDDPNRPQFKIAAAVLDPLGMPLATAVVPGNATDDPLYVPAIVAVRQSLGWVVAPTWVTARWQPWPPEPSWLLAAISTCARCRKLNSVWPSGTSCCSRYGWALRCCRRCHALVPQASLTNGWPRGSTWMWS
ncbi:hypothetical protein FTUN_7499 [Frigoriglobus tundricola]|uniref:Mobile element protein n=1 Tax=Frigoriglobus tundricola TaxID=2774151 RepID=A0A6M5Z2C9_9BACT|nr:hypothetical protein FTUN_7499 [Frigoriglobus tundricola]